jgi:hypothetical protein
MMLPSISTHHRTLTRTAPQVSCLPNDIQGLPMLKILAATGSLHEAMLTVHTWSHYSGYQQQQFAFSPESAEYTFLMASGYTNPTLQLDHQMQVDSDVPVESSSVVNLLATAVRCGACQSPRPIQ